LDPTKKLGIFWKTKCCSSVNMTNFAAFSGKFCQICHITEFKEKKREKNWVIITAPLQLGGEYELKSEFFLGLGDNVVLFILLLLLLFPIHSLGIRFFF